MAPKKKGGNKKKDDNWEDELGETIDPIAQAAQEAKDAEAAKDAEEEADEGMGGGLLAALRKNRGKKQKKGKVVEDFVEGEDPPTANGDNDATATDEAVLAAKAPVEASMEDEDDVFGQPQKKGKGGKGAQQKPAAKEEDEDQDDDDEADGTGRVKTKKEKEKEKKEREKARKKEQVRTHPMLQVIRELTPL